MNKTPLTTVPPNTIEVCQYDYGWTIGYHGPDGHVRHTLTAQAEIEAMRSAARLAKTYHVSNQVIVRSFNGEFLLDVDHLMHPRRT